MIIVLLISCLITPVEIAFAKTTTSDDGYDTQTLFGFFLDLLFFLDLVSIFFSAYVDDNLKLIDDRRVIAKTYLLGWFSVDLVSSIPFSLVDSHSGTTADIK